MIDRLLSLLSLWPLALGALGIAGGAFAILNPIKALQLARDIGGFVIEKLRALVKWFREPHDWWRIGVFSLGFGFMIASFVAWDARRTIVVVQRECAQKVTEVEAKVAAVQGVAESNYQAVQQCATTLKAEVGKRQETEKLAAAAVKAAKRNEAKAEAELAAWQKRYAQRPKKCDDALAEMEKVCATVPDN